MKKILRWFILPLSLALEILGVLSLLYINEIIQPNFPVFLGDLRLILRYVIAVIFMAAGIITFNIFGNLFSGKPKRGLLIGVTTYSTVLTLPLLYVFIGCFFVNTAKLPMVTEIAAEIIDIFEYNSNWLFGAGVLMALIFISVPIIITVLTLHEDSNKGRRKLMKRHFEEM